MCSVDCGLYELNEGSSLLYGLLRPLNITNGSLLPNALCHNIFKNLNYFSTHSVVFVTRNLSSPSHPKHLPYHMTSQYEVHKKEKQLMRFTLYNYLIRNGGLNRKCPPKHYNSRYQKVFCKFCFFWRWGL